MMRMLVVDDEDSIRGLLCEFLRREGHEVREAVDGQQALEIARQFDPKIVFLDISMPKMDGLTTLEKLRKKHPSIIVFMISGIKDEEAARSALERGAHDFITKPFDLDYLRRVLSVKLATAI